MVGQWNAEGLFLSALVRTTWPIVSGTGTYTVGPLGTVNITRPMFIQGVNFIDTSPTFPTEYQLGDGMTNEGYEGLTLKTLTSPFPTTWWYNPTFPLGTLVLWPTPTSATLTGVLYSSQVVSSFPLLTTAVSLPPGYEEMIVTNLAMRLCGPYTKPVDPSLRERAMNSVATVKRSNMVLSDLSFEAGALVEHGGTGYGYNIYTGE